MRWDSQSYLFAELNTPCICNIWSTLRNVVVNLLKMFAMTLDRYSLSMASNLYILSFHRKLCESSYSTFIYFCPFWIFSNSSTLSSSTDIPTSPWLIHLMRLSMELCTWLCLIPFQNFRLDFLQYFCLSFLKLSLNFKILA